MGGFYDVVLVVGAEQQKTMSSLDGSDVLGAAADYHNEKPEYGDFMFPKLFGRIAQIYIEKYGATEADLARVAWKNYAHAKLNPLAQMRDADLTLDCASQVSDKNPSVAPPLKVSDCSQITDGAASVVLVSGKYLDKIGRDKNKTPRLLGFGHTTDYLPLDKKDAPTFSIARKAAEKAFGMANLKPRDLQGAEVHDCFSITEIVVYEILGLAEPGKGAELAKSGATTLPQVRDEKMSGKIAIRNSGERGRRSDRRRPSCRRDRCSPGFRSVSAAHRTGRRAPDREREKFPHVQHGRQPDDFGGHDLGPRLIPRSRYGRPAPSGRRSAASLPLCPRVFPNHAKCVADARFY